MGRRERKLIQKTKQNTKALLVKTEDCWFVCLCFACCCLGQTPTHPMQGAAAPSPQDEEEIQDRESRHPTDSCKQKLFQPIVVFQNSTPQPNPTGPCKDHQTVHIPPQKV